MPKPSVLTYLDWNASAPLTEAVKISVMHAFEETGNPSSLHAPGRASKKILNQTRQFLSEVISVSPQTLFFTSGGTEANALALLGSEADVFIISPTEHDSVLKLAQHSGRNALETPINQDGVVDLEALENLLKENSGKKILISIMLANNETGVCQPVHAIAALATRYQALYHVDAVQALGKLPIDLSDAGLSGITSMSFSAHKIGGPMGIGALYVNPRISLKPLYFAGGQEKNLRPGTPNIPGIAGFGAALEKLSIADWQKTSHLRDKMETFLTQRFDKITLAGHKAPRLPNTSLMALPGIPSQTQVIHLDLAGIRVSMGAACSSGKVQGSRVLESMHYESPIVLSALRVSMGPTTTGEDIERFCHHYEKLHNGTQNLTSGDSFHDERALSNLS